MAKIDIPEYDIYYDDYTRLLYGKDNHIISNFPKGTFSYGGILYTYGTKVLLKDGYIAEYTQDKKEKKVENGRIIQMSETKEYYDGKPFELDDIFLEVNGERKCYYCYESYYYVNIQEIIDMALKTMGVPVLNTKK